LDSSNFIAIFLPLFLIFVIIIPSQRRKIFIARMMRKKRGESKVSNELIKSCVGKICTISTGSLGSAYHKVKVVEVVDKWIKIESKGSENLINSDYILDVKVLSK